MCGLTAIMETVVSKKIEVSMQTGDYIALISCIIAVLSAIIAFASAFYAKKQYRLQLVAYNDGKANYDFSIVDAYLKDINGNDMMEYYFYLRIMNLSDKATSIDKFMLELVCDNDFIYRISYSLNQGLNDMKYFDETQNIDSHNAICGWCKFIIEREKFKDFNINTYNIILQDIHKVSVQKEIVMVREVVANYEEKMAF